MTDEPLGKLNFWVLFIGFNVTFFPYAANRSGMIRHLILNLVLAAAFFVIALNRVALVELQLANGCASFSCVGISQLA